MNPSDLHLEKLLDAYFDGGMDATMQQDLEQLITCSKQARARFWERAAMDGALECWAQKSQGESMVFPAVASPRPSGWTRRLPMISGWAAAAVLLAAWLIHTRSKPGELPPEVVVESTVPTPPGAPEIRDYRPVAYLSRVSGISGDSSLTRGQSLTAGREISISEGILEVDFFSGARVSIQGPARFLPESDMRLTVHEGQVQVDVPDSAKGFVLALPDGTVTDFGTSFEVTVSNNETSRLQVSKGEIELADATPDGVAKRMFKGDAVTLAGDDGLRPIDFKEMAVKESLEARTEEESRKHAERWNLASAALARDPSVLVHFRFLPEEKDSREIINRATGPNAAGKGTVIAATWVGGRWNGKEALAFHGSADRVRVEVPGEFPQVTYLAWVKVDSLPIPYNGLFLSEANIPGEAHWQLSPDGAFMFGVRPNGTSKIMRFHRAFSEPVLPPSNYGSWHFLGTTYDSQTREVIHFVDGREVHRSLLDDSVPVRFGRATLGNFFDPESDEHVKLPYLGRNWSFRNWSGAIDEFALFSRVLEPQEILRFYEAGVPD